MASMDLEVFASESFDAKAFINAACARKTGEEPLDRFLSELEMKLHLAAEDVALYLQDHSSKAVQRIPAAVRELSRITEDVQAVRSATVAALQQLEDSGNSGTAGGTAASAVASLEEIDTVKRRMEAACSTLKEAAGLSALFQRVDDYFASGDLGRVAEALAGMRRGLAVVGDSVAEFRGGRERLQRLEEQFAAAVEAPLAAAFSGQKGEEARQLCTHLTAVQREDVAERLYCSARLAPLQTLWESFTPATPFVTWLPGFYEQAAQAIAGEADWLAQALPEQFPSLLLSLLGQLLSSIERPYRQRLGAAMSAVPGSVLPLERLEQAQAATRGFAALLSRGLVGAGALAPAEFADRLYGRVMAPVEEALLQYPDRELQYLNAELLNIAKAGSSTAGGDGTAAQLGATVTPVASALEAALARCLRLTGGTGLPALARVMDRAAAQYVGALEARVSALRAQQAGSGGGGSAGGGGDDLDAAEAAVPLLAVVAQLQAALAAVESGLRQAAAEACASLLPAAGSSEAAPQEQDGLPNAAVLRLRAQPALAQQLAALSAAAGAGSGSTGSTSAPARLLQQTMAAAAELERGVGVHVESVLTQRVRQQLAGLAGLPEWQQRQGGLPLPTFSAYPLQYVTSLGEYLMMMPQLLESSLLLADETSSAAAGSAAAAADEQGGSHELVADWIDRLALASSQLYLQQLQQLRVLTPQGAVQLAADLEYFCNVLMTLGVAVPPALAAWQAAAAAPAEGFPAVAAAAREGGAAESQAAVELVGRLRGLTITPQQP